MIMRERKGEDKKRKKPGEVFYRSGLSELRKDDIAAGRGRKKGKSFQNPFPNWANLERTWSDDQPERRSISGGVEKGRTSVQSAEPVGAGKEGVVLSALREE